MEYLTTKNGVKALKVSLDELLKFANIPPVCAGCNSGMLGDNYYIGVLSDVYCPDCYKERDEDMIDYPDDREFGRFKIKGVVEIIES